jgi:hypothetical protein
MRRQSTTKAKLVTGATIASAIAAILAFSAYKSSKDATLSVDSVKSTIKDAVKDINIPQPVSAADVNELLYNAQRTKLLSDTKSIVKKGRKHSKKLYKQLEKETKKRIKNAHNNFRK